jgi:hypothetical protein
MELSVYLMNLRDIKILWSTYQCMTHGRADLQGHVPTGLTFVVLSRVKALDGIMIVDQVDYSRVQKLGGKHMQYHDRLDDHARRHHVHK